MPVIIWHQASGGADGPAMRHGRFDQLAPQGALAFVARDTPEPTTTTTWRRVSISRRFDSMGRRLLRHNCVSQASFENQVSGMASRESGWRITTGERNGVSRRCPEWLSHR